ncbi:MAG: response regulator [Candidatus Methanomethyliaceae archaeon]
MEGGAKILAVDDDENILCSIKEILTSKGYMVDTVTTGNEALQKLKDNFYNLIIIDIKLPDIEGLNLFEMIKDTLPKIRKVVITGYPSMMNAIKALNLGANVYLMKPISPNKLVEVIEKELKIQRQELADLQNKVVSHVIKSEFKSG